MGDDITINGPTGASATTPATPTRTPDFKASVPGDMLATAKINVADEFPQNAHVSVDLASAPGL